MQRRELLKLVALASGISSVAPLSMALDLGKMIGAGTELAKSSTISDAELKGYFDQMAQKYDSQNQVAPPNDKYAKRLASLTKGMENEDGLNLDFKVYLTKEVNAFAMANGTIRVYSGLMDMMSDDEVRYVIGHEIGHVKSGHTKARMQTAMRSSALRQAVSASGGKAAALADSQLGDLFESVIRAQHSQSNENEADDYSMQFMKRRKYDAKATVTALEKLDAMSGGRGSSWLSTHPAPRERAERMRSQLA